MEVHIHPLVLINISDHCTRSRAQGQTLPILGALIGTQKGRIVEIHNCFELLRAAANGPKIMCDEFFETRRKQYLEVFPSYEILGWYSNTEAPSAQDATMREFQAVSQNDSPLLVLLHPSASSKEELPISLYDSSAKIGSDEVTWTTLPYSIDTAEAERIAVEHVAKRATTAACSDYTQHVSSLQNSVTMLDKRVASLLQYLYEVKNGKVPRNQKVLRQLLSICNSLQASWAEHGTNSELETEQQDALLCVYYAALTQICSQLSGFTEKYYSSYKKKM